jgi:hypothetical protein
MWGSGLVLLRRGRATPTESVPPEAGAAGDAAVGRVR